MKNKKTVITNNEISDGISVIAIASTFKRLDW